MKLAKPIGWLLVAMTALSLGTVGCKKPQKLTNIPGLGPRSSIGGDEPAPPINTNPFRTDANPIPQPVPPTTDGFPVSNKNWQDWPQDRATFAAQTVLFDFDKSSIKPSEVSKLEEVVRRMKTMPGKNLLIEGHCDERGTEEYNRSLGDKRAGSIREWLATHGLSADDVHTITFGEDKPVDPGHNEAAYSKNRRGEIILLSPR